MNMEMIKMVLEITGTIAIIITLIYLAIQIRDNTRIAAANARQSISESLIAHSITFFSDHKFRKTFNKHLDGEELNPEQMLYLETYAYFFFRNFENIHYQFRRNFVSKEDWTAYRKNLKALCQTPAIQNFWNRESENFNQSFYKEVTNVFAELANEPTLMPDALFQPKKKV